MRKTFKYRLYPTRKQMNELHSSLNACRWVYNKTIEIRRNSWEKGQNSLSLYDTNNILTNWKKDYNFLNNTYAQCLQETQQRVDLAFKAFFRRIKLGENPGYPRFRGANRYNSFTYKQFGFKFVNNKLNLSKIGDIKIKQHRTLQGKIKSLTISHDSVGKWWACFSCEISPSPLPIIESVVGVDVGLQSFATLSTGDKIDNPRFFKTEQKKLANAQRRLSDTKKDTTIRNKHRKRVAHIHSKISNRRRDFAHKQSKKIVDSFQIIAFEKLDIKKLREEGYKGIRKSIGDVAWNQFIQFTIYKAEDAGRTVILVDPRNTSKRCSRCGRIVEKKLSDRVHSCTCGLTLDRDHNAAINILALGLQSIASAKKLSYSTE